jgi:hypothetical protein
VFYGDSAATTHKFAAAIGAGSMVSSFLEYGDPRTRRLGKDAEYNTNKRGLKYGRKKQTGKTKQRTRSIICITDKINTEVERRKLIKLLVNVV